MKIFSVKFSKAFIEKKIDFKKEFICARIIHTDFNFLNFIAFNIFLINFLCMIKIVMKCLLKLFFWNTLSESLDI